MARVVVDGEAKQHQLHDRHHDHDRKCRPIAPHLAARDEESAAKRRKDGAFSFLRGITGEFGQFKIGRTRDGEGEMVLNEDAARDALVAAVKTLPGGETLVAAADLDPYFKDVIERTQPNWRKIVSDAVLSGIPTPEPVRSRSFFARSPTTPQGEVPDSDLRHCGHVVPLICHRGRDRKSTRLNSSHITRSRMPSSA